MIKHFETETTLTFSVVPPLYLPFYNEWGANAYHTYSAFSYDPFTLRASSTSGSPVVICGNAFFGFLNESGGHFSYDGCCELTITCAAGQDLYYNEDCNPYAEWQSYNKIIIDRDAPKQNEEFWSGLEYCTWVDQKRVAALNNLPVWDSLTEDYVYNYMRRVEKLGLPKGKLTIDDGWYVRNAADGKFSSGNWEIDRNKFPNFEQLVKDIANEGYIPGLWFSPFTATPNSELALKNPDILDGYFDDNAELAASRKLMFISPDPVLEKYYTDLFTKYISMGFKKFKLDMSYGNKAQMKQLLALIYKIIKGIDKTIEVEAHMPDIFCSRYCDTVRINDVAFDEKDVWRAVTMEHYKVCKFSSPDRILNLDHVGTNEPLPREEQYIAHAKLLTGLDGGYPCVSLLPDDFSLSVQDEFVGYIRDWVARQK